MEQASNVVLTLVIFIGASVLVSIKAIDSAAFKDLIILLLGYHFGTNHAKRTAKH